MIRFATIIALLLFEVSPSFAAPPKLDVRTTCRRSQPLTGRDQQTAYQGCMRDEADAQKDLIKTWSTFKPSAQAICVQETKIGGAPSYVEVLTCLQLDKEAGESRSRTRSRYRRLRRNRELQESLGSRRNSGGSPSVDHSGFLASRSARLEPSAPPIPPAAS